MADHGLVGADHDLVCLKKNREATFSQASRFFDIFSAFRAAANFHFFG
jgi:hypothetical protein